MIADVKRAYIPTVTYKYGGFQQQSIAQIQAFNNSAVGTYPNVLPVQLDPTLVHRKIWAWFWSVSATWSLDVDLVFWLNSVEKFRQKIVVWTPQSQNNKFAFCFQQATAAFGAVNEQLLFSVASTANFTACAHRLNIAADLCFLQINSITGAAATFDAGLHAQSQAGI